MQRSDLFVCTQSTGGVCVCASAALLLLLRRVPPGGVHVHLRHGGQLVRPALRARRRAQRSHLPRRGDGELARMDLYRDKFACSHMRGDGECVWIEKETSGII